MKQITLIGLLLIALFTIIFNACNNSTQTDNIKIGVILPLTGKFAVIGEGEKKGIEMAIDSLKKKFSNKKIEVVFEDFASETKNAVTAANKLISVDKVDAIITSTTAAAEAVSPIVEKAHIINFVISPDMGIVKKSNYNFRVYYNFNTEAEVANSFVKKMKPSSIAFLATRYSSLQKLVDESLEKSFISMGIKVSSKQYTELQDKDFKNQILRIKTEAPELLYLVPMTNQVDLFANQLSEYDYKPDSKKMIFGSFLFNWKPDVFLNTLEGYYIATPFFQTLDSTNSFKISFNSKYKTNPSFDIAYAYDNAMILIDLLNQSKKDFIEFKNKFNKMGTINAASGEIIFTGDNDTKSKIIVTKIVNGKRLIQE
jgi:branched-chain amino acid transport system substrate-binding protein